MYFLLACGTEAPSPDSAGDSAQDTGALDSGDSAAPVDSGDSGQPPPFEGMHLGIPALGAPDGEAWSGWVAGAAATGGWLYVNVDEGPGATKDNTWAAAIAGARAEGVVVVGYVGTESGTRDADDVERDIGRWAAWFDVDGVVFDVVGADCATMPTWYAEQVALADSKDPGGDAFVVLTGAGTACEGWAAVGDVLVVASGGASALAAVSPPAWMEALPPQRFAAFVTAVSADERAGSMQAAVDAGIGTVYVTDDVDPAPFDALPTYWTAEIESIAQ
ncbi:hypothetical protein LBMAG42_28370 [Deltaproteobacteria bacterium]|nr:hypothetical protein LBMAG42_28370 [Deltaproteobacteria bacterium]